MTSFSHHAKINILPVPEGHNSNVFGEIHLWHEWYFSRRISFHTVSLLIAQTFSSISCLQTFLKLSQFTIFLSYRRLLLNSWELLSISPIPTLHRVLWKTHAYSTIEEIYLAIIQVIFPIPKKPKEACVSLIIFLLHLMPKHIALIRYMAIIF